MITGLLTGAAITVVVGFTVMIATDKEVRDNTTGFLWGLAAGPVLLFLMLVVWLFRVTGNGHRRIPVLRGRRLSTTAMRRFTARVDAGGWVVTWRGGGLLWIKKVRAK